MSLETDNEEKENIENLESYPKTKIDFTRVKLIAPFVMLSGTAIISIFTYLQHYNGAEWLIIVLGSLILFLIIGEALQLMIMHFMEVNQDKIDRANAMEQEDSDEDQEESDDQQQS